METKKSKVTKIAFKKEFKGQKGVIFYYDIEFESGDKGQFSTNKNPQVKFKEGEEVDYTREEIEKEYQGKKYTEVKIDKPKQDYNGGGQSGNYQKKNDPAKNARIMRSVALEQAIKCQGFTQGIEGFATPDIFKEMVAWLYSMSVIGEPPVYDEAVSISSQVGLKMAVLFYETKLQQPKDLKEFFGYANQFFKLCYYEVK